MKNLYEELLFACIKKYMYDCWQEDCKVISPDEWFGYQFSRNKFAVLGDVVSGFDPTELDKTIQSTFPSFFKGQRGAYDFFSEDEKKHAAGKIVTYDNIFISKLRLWDWLFNTGFIPRFFGATSFIEVNLICDVSMAPDKIDLLKLYIKIQTKEMSKAGKGELAEIRFNIDNGVVGSAANKEWSHVNFEEVLMMHQPFGSYTEKEMEEHNERDLIQFMQNFIENAEKMVMKR
jgi:hypothetical protein